MAKTRVGFHIGVALIASSLLLPFLCTAQVWQVHRISLAYSGGDTNAESGSPAVSDDGRYVAFHSLASNLVVGDSNVTYDVFVTDRSTGITERVSISSSDAQANGSSYYPSISADGRYVAFRSAASNLVSGDTNLVRDIFVRDRMSGVTERVSLTSGGEQSNGPSDFPSISGDGRFVAFESSATNLVSGDTNMAQDVFVRDRLLGVTERVSVSSAGMQATRGSYRPDVTSDGRFVAFHSYASNLVAADTNGSTDVFVRDRQASTTELVSVSSAGTQGNLHSSMPSISADGRYVAFQSDAWTLVENDTNAKSDVFVRDRHTGTTQLGSLSSTGSQGNDASTLPAISGNGRFVSFVSRASDLVPDDQNGQPDVFHWDRVSGTISLVSTPQNGQPANGASGAPAVCFHGRHVAFESKASNLVADDTNGVTDVFLAATDSQVTISLSGWVRFLHLAPGVAGPDTVSFRLSLDAGPAYHLLVPLAPDGGFAISVPGGTSSVQVSLKHTHWLRRTILVATSAGDVGGIELILVNGDSVQDNRLDLLDLNQVLAQFARSHVDADLDESGAVGLGDLNIVLLGFGLYGDP